MCASALMLDRLASHAAAGCSRPTGGYSVQVGERASRRAQAVTVRAELWREHATCMVFQLSCDSQTTKRWNKRHCRKFKRRKLTQVKGTLQAADYGVYKEVPSDQITEKFLWGRLRPLLDYLDENDIEKVHEALFLASDAHAGQLRKSGEPYITHPVEVARLLAELRMDSESLIAGLLHDTVEDNPGQITFEEIGVWFGQAVRTIVEGETKFSKIGQLSSDRASSADVKARDLQHLFLAMTKEVRIIVVKLADRLHNMRTLDSMPPHKQLKIAEETLQVFAPLARLLGLYSIKEELEELAFSYSKPEEYILLRRRLDQLAAEQEPVVLKAKQALEEMLQQDVYLLQRADSVKIVPTQKSVYSVYRKLEETKRSISDVTDVAQLCVVIHLKEDQETYLFGTGSQLCYHVMGLVHTKWAPIPGSIKDYIATPKRNGYQSLHTTVLPLGSTPLFPLEVLIRTSKMQELAEFGIAGEKWVATDAQSFSFDSQDLDMEGDLDRQLEEKPRNGGGVVGDILKLVPRLMGLNHRLVNGKATLTVNGTVINSQRGINGRHVTGAVTNLAGRPALTANGFRHPKAAQEGVTIKQSGSARLDRDVLKRREHWLKSIIEWQKEFVDSLSAREFVDGITDDLLGRGVFVFTPSGDLMRLPKDSTTVDFAYHVHTDVGNQMVGAKVNGKLVNPDHLLANAEVVEILTYNGPPTRVSVARHYEWSKFAKSKTARHKLAKFLREHAELLPSHLKMPPNGLTEKTENGSDSESTLARKENTVWLDVEGAEGPGLLAELAQIIAKHGHDVKTYSGSVNPSSGTLRMRFEVSGIAGECEAMCAEIESAPFVRSWKLECSLDFQSRIAQTIV